MKRITAAILLCLAASPAAGQTIAEQLKSGMDAYQNFRTEEAKNIFATIIASQRQVTPEQRVTALKYLGAYWALQSSPGARDSAKQFFMAAIDYDPFTDLDRTIFAADEQNAFALARNALFKVAVAPVEPKAIDPTSQKAESTTYPFRIVTTKVARTEAAIVKLDNNANQLREVIATAANSDGVRDVVWTGLVNNVRADTGLYEMELTAWDLANPSAQPTKERQRFRVEHHHAKLEDSLPPFRDVNTGGTDTLRSRYSALKPVTDGGKGMFIAAVAVGLPFITFGKPSDNPMSGWQQHFFVGIGVGAVAGVGAAWFASSNRDDRKAARENERRRNERDQHNAGVRARNAARLAKTILVIRPLTSAGIAGG